MVEPQPRKEQFAFYYYHSIYGFVSQVISCLQFFWLILYTFLILQACYTSRPSHSLQCGQSNKCTNYAALHFAYPSDPSSALSPDIQYSTFLSKTFLAWGQRLSFTPVILNEIIANVVHELWLQTGSTASLILSKQNSPKCKWTSLSNVAVAAGCYHTSGVSGTSNESLIILA